MERSEAVKVTVIIEMKNGDVLTVVGDKFDYLEMGNDPTEPESIWNLDPYTVARSVRRNLTFELHGSEHHSMVWREYQPPLEDPTVVEMEMETDGR